MQDIILFMQHHGALSLAFALVLFLLILLEFMRLKQGSNRISPNQATALINHQNAVVVDIRDADSFANGHIVDAVSFPPQDSPHKYKKLEKYKSQPIVLVCATGLESPREAVELTKLGFNVFILAGGIRAWRMAEMPLVKT